MGGLFNLGIGALGALGGGLAALKGGGGGHKRGHGGFGGFHKFKGHGGFGVISVGTEILVVIREEVLRVTTRAKRCKSIVQWGGLFTFLGCYNW